jgi:hypothetical protein
VPVQGGLQGPGEPSRRVRSSSGTAGPPGRIGAWTPVPRLHGAQTTGTNDVAVLPGRMPETCSASESSATADLVARLWPLGRDRRCRGARGGVSHLGPHLAGWGTAVPAHARQVAGVRPGVATRRRAVD